MIYSPLFWRELCSFSYLLQSHWEQVKRSAKVLHLCGWKAHSAHPLHHKLLQAWKRITSNALIPIFSVSFGAGCVFSHILRYQDLSVTLARIASLSHWCLSWCEVLLLAVLHCTVEIQAETRINSLLYCVVFWLGGEKPGLLPFLVSLIFGLLSSRVRSFYGDQKKNFLLKSMFFEYLKVLSIVYV